MNFTTKIPISKYNNSIDYNAKIVSLGSCFAENMGQKFHYYKFQNKVNPFGIIFNPIAIEKLIIRIVNNQEFTEKDIFFFNECWHCYEVHSELSNSNKEDFLQNLNAILLSTKNEIANATHILITYGTSWVYRLKSNNEIVANCHKVPQNQFTKELLSVDSIQKSIENTIKLIQKTNPNCHFIFTVSPVRHIKDGFVENNISKAHLLSSIYNSQFIIHHSNYFPSYEIVMDELRDYRFYAEDMLHPNSIAIDYIWERLSENYIAETSLAIMSEVENIQKSLAHRPFNQNTQANKDFVLKLKNKIELLQKRYPNINF
jgi:GSCFA family